MDLDALLDELGDLTPVYVIATCLLLLPSSLSYHLSIRPSSWGDFAPWLQLGKNPLLPREEEWIFPFQ